MTREVIEKLEKAFSYTYTDAEACLYAGISEDVLYAYQKRRPDFVNRKNALRLTPNLHAKETLVQAIPKNLEQSRWWAKNAPAMRQEFGEVQKVEHSGVVATEDPAVHPEDEELRIGFKQKLQENIRRRAVEKAKQKPDAETKPVQ